VDVLAGAAAPLLAAGDQLHLDDALGAQIDGHVSVGILGGERHVDADGLGQRRRDLRLANHLREVHRPDLLLAFPDQHEVDRRLASRPSQRVERREEGRLGPLLVHRAAANHHLAETRLVDQPRLPRRRWWAGGSSPAGAARPRRDASGSRARPGPGPRRARGAGASGRPRPRGSRAATYVGRGCPCASLSKPGAMCQARSGPESLATRFAAALSSGRSRGAPPVPPGFYKHIEGVMRTLPRKRIVACLCVALAGGAIAVAAPPVFWGQWGRTALHQGSVPVAGQTGSSILANIVYDPFTSKEQQGPY